MITIFIHVPRTAGTTLRIIAEKQWPLPQIIQIYGKDIEHPREALARIPEQVLRSAKMIRGHFAYGIHEALPKDVPYQYITLLRNPVDRVVSLYKQICRSRNHPFHSMVGGRTLNRFMESCISEETSNGMTFQLSGMRGELSQVPCRSRTGPPADPIDVAALYAAKKHLRDFAFVGTCERFGHAITNLNKLLGWRPVPYGTENATRYWPLRPSPAVRRLIEGLNRWDIQLYQWVVGGMR